MTMCKCVFIFVLSILIVFNDYEQKSITKQINTIEETTKLTQMYVYLQYKVILSGIAINIIF